LSVGVVTSNVVADSVVDGTVVVESAVQSVRHRTTLSRNRRDVVAYEYVKTFFYVFFLILVTFLRFLTFSYFPNVFLFKKTLAKFSSIMLHNIKDFTASLKRRQFLQNYSELPWRPFLGHQAWSWTTARRGNVFCYVYKRFCLNFLSRFKRFLTFL